MSFGVSLDGEELTRRLNTIATNAIREAQIALGRGDYPWIDDDWRRQHMISQILDLTRVDQIDAGREHYPLNAPFQAPKNPRLDVLEAKLADALAGLDSEIEPTDSITRSPAAKTTRPKLS
jgi:hypothetical protein